MADPKIFKYKVKKNGEEKIYDIPENKLADFKLEFPKAEEIKDNNVIETDTSAIIYIKVLLKK